MIRFIKCNNSTFKWPVLIQAKKNIEQFWHIWQEMASSNHQSRRCDSDSSEPQGVSLWEQVDETDWCEIISAIWFGWGITEAVYSQLTCLMDPELLGTLVVPSPVTERCHILSMHHIMLMRVQRFLMQWVQLCNNRECTPPGTIFLFNVPTPKKYHCDLCCINCLLKNEKKKKK